MVDDIDKLYGLFRKRAQTKSNDNYVDKGKNPVLMILNIDHYIMDCQVGVVVKYKSFKIIENDEKLEIGFSVVVYIPFSDDEHVLSVHKNGKAFIENKKELEIALKKSKKNK